MNGTVISREGEAPKREDFRALVLKGQLADALNRLNPKLPPDAIAEVVHVGVGAGASVAGAAQPGVSPLADPQGEG